MRNTIVQDEQKACRRVNKAGRQDLLRQQGILPQAREIYDMFLFSYQERGIGGIELVEGRRTLNESRKSCAKVRCEYGLALAPSVKRRGHITSPEKEDSFPQRSRLHAKREKRVRALLCLSSHCFLRSLANCRGTIDKEKPGAKQRASSLAPPPPERDRGTVARVEVSPGVGSSSNRSAGRLRTNGRGGRGRAFQ